MAQVSFALPSGSAGDDSDFDFPESLLTFDRRDVSSTGGETTDAGSIFEGGPSHHRCRFCLHGFQRTDRTPSVSLLAYCDSLRWFDMIRSIGAEVFAVWSIFSSPLRGRIGCAE